MPALIASLTSSAPSAVKFPPNPPTILLRPQHSTLEANTISRRNAAVLLPFIITPLLSSLTQPPIACAFTLGISGPKEWLKEQKKKSAKYLLAPVDASRNILQSAYLLLMKSEEEFGEKELEQLQNLLISASRDCVPGDRNSFVEFQSNTGVEVCTFRLVVKNASSLLDDRDPLKLEAENKLTALIRSFSSLNGMARGDVRQLTLNRQRVVDALKDTVSSLNNFEQGIKDCLQVQSL